MRKILFGVLLSIMSQWAQAGQFTDSLSRCFLESTSEQDKLEYMRWLVASMSLHPALDDLTAVQPEERVKLNQSMAALTYRLMSKDCLEETKAAFMFEGENALMSSFQLFGEAAAELILSHPIVDESVKEVDKYFDGEGYLRALTEDE